MQEIVKVKSTNSQNMAPLGVRGEAWIVPLAGAGGDGEPLSSVRRGNVVDLSVEARGEDEGMPRKLLIPGVISKRELKAYGSVVC